MTPTTMIRCEISRWFFNSRKNNVLEEKVVEIDEATATSQQLASYKKHYDNATNITCIMVATMIPKLQRFYEDYSPYYLYT